MFRSRRLRRSRGEAVSPIDLARRIAYAGGTLLLAVVCASAQEPTRLPKYGSQAVRLFLAREYIQNHPAPDFWALTPYYAAQPDDRSCSAASVAMLVNALRAEEMLKADEQLATPDSVAACVAPHVWKDKLAPGGVGVTLDELAAIARAVFAAHALGPVRVETMRFSPHDIEARARLQKVLASNERSARNLILVNFLQSIATGDPEGAVGHMAPIGAYDAERRRVLLFDPDRQWYEPYWISEETLLHAMATIDPVSNQPRGLLVIERTENH